MNTPPATPGPYGPGTPMVRRFLVQLAGLGTAGRQQVVAQHSAIAPTPAFTAAEIALGEAIERSGRTDARDALAGPLLQLVRRTDATAGIEDELEAFDAIAEPALGALLALLVADLLSADIVALLYAPFDSVIPYKSLGTAG